MIRDKTYVCGIIKKKSQSVLTQLPKSLWLKKKTKNVKHIVIRTQILPSGIWIILSLAPVNCGRQLQFVPSDPLSSPSYCQLQEAGLNGILGQALYCLISSQFSQWWPQQEIRKKEENEDGICVLLVLSAKSCLRLTSNINCMSSQVTFCT